MLAPRRPRLIYLVGEDWFFVSHRLDLGIAAKRSGYDVAVATRVGKAADTIRDAGLDVIPLPLSRSSLSPAGEARLLAALVSLYRRERPDLVHHVAAKPVVYGSLAARAAGVRNVINAMSGLGYVFSSDSAKARALRPILRRLYKSVLAAPGSRVILQNHDDVALFKREGLAPDDAIRLIRGSGVDTDRVTPRDREPDGPPIVVLPARMLRDKGVLEFVEAARELKRGGIAARFVLCGEPDPLNPASLGEADIAGFVADGSVEYWGWQNDMRPVWRQAHVACLPSYREGLPKALLEASAAGLPLVATDVPGCREIARDRVNAWTVPARDASALAAALREAIARADLRADYGRRGREMVEREFSLASVIDQTLAVYAELVPRAAT